MADLLIQGASLPKDGELVLVIYSDGACKEYGTTGPWYDTAVIPKHGRLIDADAFRAEHGMMESCENCPEDDRRCQHEMIYTKMEVCGWIDDAEIIISASKENTE